MTDATLPEQIALKLRRDILRGTLAPGDPIKERDNALDLGVSRTPRTPRSPRSAPCSSVTTR